MKTGAIVILKVCALITLYFVLFIVISGVVAAGAEPPPEDQMSLVFTVTLFISCVNVIIATLIIRSSRWHGWRLAGSVALALYGVATFLSAIEVLYYAPALGISYQDVVDLLPEILLPNLILFAIFMPVAVRVLGKWRPTDDVEAGGQPSISTQQWLVKAMAVAIIYYVLYFSFGFFVAWSNPELQAMYSTGVDNTALMVWGVIPLQLFRGLLWVLITIPIIRMVRLQPWTLALVVGLLCSLPMSVPLFMPNELMADAGARLSHFYEITASNFILGIILVWFFHRKHYSVRDLLGLGGVSASHESSSIGVAPK